MSDLLRRVVHTLVDSRQGRLLIVLANAGAITGGIWFAISGVELFSARDAEIYLEAGRRIVEGAPLYEFGHAVTGFGFTYPPFAAMLFALLVPLGPLAPHFIQALSLISLIVVITTTLCALGASGARLAWGAAALTPLLLLLYPNARSIGSGQIDLILAAVVLLDLLALTGSRAQGILAGLAAAVKLTPSLFVLVLLFRAPRRAVVTMVATAVTTIVLGSAVAPADSREFWTSALWNTTRVGDQTAALNQSWAALVARLLPGDQQSLHGVGFVVWGALVVLTLAWTLHALARRREGHLVTDIAMVALCALLVSPISWLHHWSVATVALILLGQLSLSGSRLAGGLLVAGLAVLAVPAFWYLGSYVGGDWGLLETLVGSATVLWGAAVLAYLGSDSVPPRAAPAPANLAVQRSAQI